MHESALAPSRRTVLSAAALLGGGAVLSSSLSPATAVEATATTGPTGYSGLSARRNEGVPPVTPYHYRSRYAWNGWQSARPGVMTLNPKSNTLYAGGFDADFPGLSSTVVTTRAQDASPDEANIGWVCGMTVGGDNLYFGTLDDCSLYVHHMPSGVSTASSYRKLGSLGDRGQMLANAWADAGDHVVFGTAPDGTGYNTGGDFPEGSSGLLGTIDKATGTVSVHSAPFTGHRIMDLAALGATVFGVTLSSYPRGASIVFSAEAATGRILWQHELEGGAAHGIVTLEGLVYAAAAGKVLELDPVTGDIVRTFTNPGIGTPQYPQQFSLNVVPGTKRLLHAGDYQSVIISTRSGMVSTAGSDLEGLVFSDNSGAVWSTNSGGAFQPIRMFNGLEPGKAPYLGPLVSPFIDVATTHVFYNEISWLSANGVSGGWSTSRGKEFRPTAKVTREIMAAFLYRLAGSPEYTAPEASPFADVDATRAFYKHMAWLAEEKISTGWSGPNGTRLYKPEQNVLRDQMAAFMYRLAGSPAYTPPARSAFVDVPISHPFYKQISWLAAMNVSGGWSTSRGKEFRPYSPVLRDQMAAFMYRLAATTL